MSAGVIFTAPECVTAAHVGHELRAICRAVIAVEKQSAHLLSLLLRFPPKSFTALGRLTQPRLGWHLNAAFRRTEPGKRRRCGGSEGGQPRCAALGCSKT